MQKEPRRTHREILCTRACLRNKGKHSVLGVDHTLHIIMLITQVRAEHPSRRLDSEPAHAEERTESFDEWHHEEQDR